MHGKRIVDHSFKGIECVFPQSALTTPTEVMFLFILDSLYCLKILKITN